MVKEFEDSFLFKSDNEWTVKVIHEEEQTRIEYVWENGYRMRLFPAGYQLVKDGKIVYEALLQVEKRRGEEEK